MRFLLISCILILFTGHTINAQSKDKKDSIKDEKSDVLKNTRKIEGIITIYQDTLKGNVKAILTKEQLEKEYIYFNQISNGITVIRLNKGRYGDNFIFKFEKKFNKINIVRINTSFYFDPENPISKAQNTNISHSLIESLKIEKEMEGGYLVNLDPLFLEETMAIIKPPKSPNSSPNSFSLGNLSKEKTQYVEIKNYSNNLNIESQYVYSKGVEFNDGDNTLADARNISISVYHSIIEVPNNNYKTRLDDPRIGYFLTQVDDQTTTETVHYKDMIHRWNLEKKDPSASISDPVKPITWWIENTTPYEFRETVKQGVLKWNKAFEKAGFSNAIEVKIQPDEATWDAGDINYNVLRWTSSPNPPFGGYGPSFVNPKTGEILGADIMLEYVHHTNRVFYEKLYPIESHSEENFHNYCSAGHLLHKNLQLGRAILLTQNFPAEELERMTKEAMLELVMHEIGHTLGLNHNMKASYLYTPEQLYDKNFTQNKALAGSVMDYIGINLHPDSSQQGSFYSTEVGPYDIWAIEYGYKDTTEKDLQRIAERSNEPQLIFGNDADDMRSPGRGMDPRVNVSDISNNPLQYEENKMKLISQNLSKLKNTFNTQGDFYEDLRRGYYVLMGSYWNSNEIISRFIGGVYINRSTIGQKDEKAPYIPVEYATQKKAMRLLSQYAFAPNAFEVSEEILPYIAKQRRGFNFFAGADDPKYIEEVLRNQKEVLDQLLHSNTLERIVNSSAYGNKYSITEFLDELTDSIFKEDIKGNVNIKRQNLQAAYVDMLTKKFESKSLEAAQKSALWKQLTDIKKLCKNKKGDAASKAHKNYLFTMIEGIK